jgi:hypothetical protein
VGPAVVILSLLSWGSPLPSAAARTAPTQSTSDPFAGWSLQAPEAIDWAGACCTVRGEWYVGLEDGRVTVSGAPPPQQATLPFYVDFAGARRVLAVEGGGYLVGFDAGEFGGGAWWYAADGTRRRKLTLRASDALADYIPENVHAFARLGRDVIVFEGLTHMRTDSGRVVRLHRDPHGRWQPSLYATLSSCPHAVVEESRSTWLLATTLGVFRFDTRAQEHRVWKPPSGQLHYPNSIVRDRSGFVYVGLRNVVLRLAPEVGGRYSARVLVPPVGR